MRYAIVGPNPGPVITVVDYATAPGNPPPGFGAGVLAIQSNIVGGDWSWDGTNLIAPVYPVPPAQPQSIASQDIVAQLTKSDAQAIQTTIASNQQVWLSWSSMLAHKENIYVTDPLLVTWWTDLTTALSNGRMKQLAKALGISDPTSTSS